MDKTHVHLRGARDRLVDLLGIGETYPLQDVQVVDERITVPINSTAKIPLSPGQTDVRYKLCDPHERPLDQGPGLAGNGMVTILESPPIREDLTFRVLARKIDSGREAFLHQSAAIKVGLDATLSARIVNADLLLQPPGATPDVAPRIVPYGSGVFVEVDRSQEGVEYQLVHMVGEGAGAREKVVSVQLIRGNLRTITLTSDPFFEDTEIRIRATKRFDPSENREAQTTLLDIVLPLAVRANQAVELRVAGSPLIDFDTAPALVLSKTQKSVQYRLHARTLRDGDFVYGSVPPTVAVSVTVPGLGVVQVAKPADRAWTTTGYNQTGEPKQGNDGPIEWTPGKFIEDTILVVEATKEHSPDKVPSSVQAATPAVVLVRPDPGVRLTINAAVNGTAIKDPLLVAGGSPGVFYYFGDVTPLPAYFHKLDDTDLLFNKGVGQLRVSVDFAVARSPHEAPEVDLARARPLDPMVETSPVTLPATLPVRAVKARTQADVASSRNATLAAPPLIRSEPETVVAGSPASIVIAASRPEERYQLATAGQTVGEALMGSGEDLELRTEPLSATTDFEVRITRPAATGHEVIEIVALTVRVSAAN